MIFLIEYDRQQGRLVSLKKYEHSQRTQAEEARLTMELRLRGAKIEREIVLLEANSEAALKKTHRRYFESLNTLAKSA